MLMMGLLPKQRKLLRNMVAVCERVEQTGYILNGSTLQIPPAETPMPAENDDILHLQRLGFLSAETVTLGSTSGDVLQKAFDAVRADFVTPAPLQSGHSISFTGNPTIGAIQTGDGSTANVGQHVTTAADAAMLDRLAALRVDVARLDGQDRDLGKVIGLLMDTIEANKAGGDVEEKKGLAERLKPWLEVGKMAAEVYRSLNE